VSEVLSQLDLNSESVMDKSALNDLDNELNTSLSSTASRMSYLNQPLHTVLH